VDGNPVTMVQVNGSENAEVPLTVVNTPGFDLPQTGDHGTWMYGVIGISMMAGALVVMMFAFKKKDEKQPAQQ
jgi:LPXTG-motif cell wall-anchored protein